MKVRYNKGMGCPVEISDGKTATCISLDTAKKLQASLLAVIEQAEMPEEEMIDFVKEYCQLYKEGYADGQAGSEQLSDAILKDSAAELLSLARDQFIKDGYVIEKKAFHDAVEKVATEVMKEVSDKVDMEDAIRLGYEKGMADALKDLPRWDDCWRTSLIDKPSIINQFLVYKGRKIILADLEKLPGFNE